MDPQKLTGIDQRLTGICAYCGGHPNTRDHVPSRVLLDEPFPPDLPVVEACNPCNAGFSKDELYLAALIECILAGTTELEKIRRTKIARRLGSEPALMKVLAKSRGDSGPPSWDPDQKRVRNVMYKLAQGHAAWDLALPNMGLPTLVEFAALPTISPSQRTTFEMPPTSGLWPELGSRAFYRAVAGLDGSGWQEVQAGRYRYCVDQDEGVTVRFVIGDYLACRVHWE